MRVSRTVTVRTEIFAKVADAVRPSQMFIVSGGAVQGERGVQYTSLVRYTNPFAGRSRRSARPYRRNARFAEF